MLYIYAIAEELRDISDLAGVQGERIEAVPVAGACAVVGEVSAQPPLDASVLRSQDALVRALHERARALLPMRFGTMRDGRDAMLRSLETRADLRARLAAVRDSEQMTVRVLGAAPAEEALASAATTGTEYLRARARRSLPSPALETLAKGVGALARDVRVEPAFQPRVIGTVYHLIERGRAQEYRAAIERIARDMPEDRIHVSGPSPAYAFA